MAFTPKACELLTVLAKSRRVGAGPNKVLYCPCTPPHNLASLWLDPSYVLAECFKRTHCPYFIHKSYAIYISGIAQVIYIHKAEMAIADR